MALEIVILAAGMGKRMRSTQPKVLHKVAGEPMLFHVIKTAFGLNPEKIHVVLGHKSEVVEESLKQLPQNIQDCIKISVQKEQAGTAHAVMQAVPNLGADENKVIILYGDTPLTPKDALESLLQVLENKDLALLTAHAENPFGYGRILRQPDGSLIGIVEEKDATAEQKLIDEINTGMIATTAANLRQYLPQISNNNAQGEYYLTDLLGLMVQAGLKAESFLYPNFDLLNGVNNKMQLAFVERVYQRAAAQKCMENGLTLADPERFDLRGTLDFGMDCSIDTNVIIEGKVVLGDNVTIGTGCVLKDVTIGDNSVISPYTVMEKSELHKGTTIGPFARLRPGNVLEDEVHVGNFVEVKNSHICKGTKSGHLTYIGDSDIGENTNIGAGTITCNYDGANKHRTTIGKDVFIGSDTQLVAPVTVEDGATVGAGATVTRTVAAHSLFVTRARPHCLPNYKRPTKKAKK